MKRPVPDPGWSADVRELYENDLREMWEPAIEPHTFHAYQARLDALLKITEAFSPKTVLDVGCAQGTLALLIAERGCSVTAVDIRPQFLRYAESRWERGDVRFVDANIFDAPSLGTFDMIFANQVIEHLLEPAAFLRILRTYANPGAKIVVTTPNHSYLANHLPSHAELGDRAAHREREFSARGDDHFFLYTAEELKQAFGDAGLRVLRSGYWESPWLSGHMKIRHLHKLRPLVPLLRIADTRTLAVAGRLLGHQMYVIGESPA